MAPDPGASDQGKRTVACNFETLVPDETHKAAIRDAVHRTHKATILATETPTRYHRGESAATRWPWWTRKRKRLARF